MQNPYIAYSVAKEIYKKNSLDVGIKQNTKIEYFQHKNLSTKAKS